MKYSQITTIEGNTIKEDFVKQVKPLRQKIKIRGQIQVLRSGKKNPMQKDLVEDQIPTKNQKRLCVPSGNVGLAAWSLKAGE